MKNYYGMYSEWCGHEIGYVNRLHYLCGQDGVDQYLEQFPGAITIEDAVRRLGLGGVLLLTEAEAQKEQS